MKFKIVCNVQLFTVMLLVNETVNDFAFIVSKDIKAQDLINAVSSVDQNLISNIKVFDVYEGENIPENQKSIAISVTCLLYTSDAADE